MNQKPDKRQIIEIIIEVVIVLVVCGFVGFLTYDNIIKKEEALNPTVQEMQTTTTTNSEVESSEITETEVTPETSNEVIEELSTPTEETSETTGESVPETPEN